MSDVRYYVLFANYEQGLKLHGILDGAGVQNRIAPGAPLHTGGAFLRYVAAHRKGAHRRSQRSHKASGAEYHDIVPLEGQMKAHRDKYC